MINLIRFFKVDGSFHYIHAKDIAQIIKYVIQNPSLTLANKDIVLGNKKTTVNEAVEKICKYLDKQIYFRIPLSITLANIFIKIFRLRMEAWDYFSMNYRHFTYKKTTIPFDFGINNSTPPKTPVLPVKNVLVLTAPPPTVFSRSLFCLL